MSYELINAKNISDFYSRLGSCYYCSQVTAGNTKAYHVQYAYRWLNFIKEFDRICIEEKQTIQNPDAVMVRKLLYEHFPDELKCEVSYLYGVDQCSKVYRPEAFNRSVLRCLNSWLEGKDHVESV